MVGTVRLTIAQLLLRKLLDLRPKETCHQYDQIRPMFHQGAPEEVLVGGHSIQRFVDVVLGPILIAVGVHLERLEVEAGELSRFHKHHKLFGYM
jgi:hypothetical protein